MLDTESPTPTKLAVGMVQGLRSEWKVGNRDTTGTFGTVCVTRQGTWGGVFLFRAGLLTRTAASGTVRLQGTKGKELRGAPD